MPYITKDQKIELSIHRMPENAGELNYIFTRYAVHYLDKKGMKYQHFNDIIGALEGCKMELYRRLVADYEDQKCEDNGDVYQI